MKYLFFDIECCNGINICEFGYVLSDDMFNVLEKDCITINPEHKFRLTGRVHESDISLAFSEEVYLNSPTFPVVYESIKTILTTPDCTIIGFSLANDCSFLATAYAIYGLEPIKFSYIDFQKLYHAYSKSVKRTSIESIVKELHIEGITLHKSDDDAYAVMLAIKTISKTERASFPDTIKLLERANVNYMEERAKERNLSLIEKALAGNEKAQKEFIKTFIHGLSINENSQESIFNGKVVSISGVYQRKYFNEFLTIIERLYSVGATYTGKASECDFFIEYFLPDDEDNRILSARRVINEGKNIEIMSLEVLLKELALTVKDLAFVDHIHGEAIFDKRDLKKKKNQNYIDNCSVANTLGDILKAQGVDLSTLSEDED